MLQSGQKHRRSEVSVSELPKVEALGIELRQTSGYAAPVNVETGELIRHVALKQCGSTWRSGVTPTNPMILQRRTCSRQVICFVSLVSLLQFSGEPFRVKHELGPDVQKNIQAIAGRDDKAAVFGKSRPQPLWAQAPSRS